MPVKIQHLLRRLSRSWRLPVALAIRWGRPLLTPRGGPQILDQYVTTTPSPQNAVDIFAGEWSSKLPEPFAEVRAGSALLFADARLEWGLTQLGGVTGKTVLELGPLEGGHTYMLEQGGAASVVAIEANTRAYLKCLITKELLGLKRARFLCGNFVAFLQANAT